MSFRNGFILSDRAAEIPTGYSHGIEVLFVQDAKSCIAHGSCKRFCSVAAVVIQFCVEGVVQALIGRYQNNATTVFAKQFAHIAQCLPVVLDMFYHVKCEDRIISCQLTRIQFCKFRMHQIEIDNAPQGGVAGKPGIQVSKVILAQVAEGNRLIVL